MTAITVPNSMVTSYGVRKSRTCASVRPNPDKQNEPETEMTDSAVGTACIYCSAMHNYGACYTLFTCTYSNYRYTSRASYSRRTSLTSSPLFSSKDRMIPSSSDSL